MSEKTENPSPKPKIYVPGTQVKEFTFPSGDKVLRLSINLSKFAPFVKQYKNENGYINFNINPRKEIGTYGDSHTVSLDQWKPNPKTDTKPETTTEKSAKSPEKKSTKPVEKTPEPAAEEDDNF